MTGGVMRPDDPMRQSGAVWCDQHGRWECSKNAKRTRARCHQPAIRGTASCRTHAGKSSAIAKAQGEANLLAWSTAAASDERPLDTGRVVMDQLRVAVLRADLYAERLRLQLETEDAAGLVGATYTVGREGQMHQTGEAVRGLQRLEESWRDRAVRFAKTAHDMGIDERQVEFEQAQAAFLVGALRAAIDAVELSPVQRSGLFEAFLGALGRGERAEVSA